MVNKINFSFDKKSNLENGDKVTISVKSSSDSSPIKITSKSFTVKGLKVVKEMTQKGFVKEHPIVFEGFNGFGDIKKSDKNSSYSIKSSGSLSNGDTVNLKINNTDRGVKISGEQTVAVKVSGLKEFNDIPNLNDAVGLIDNLAKADNKDALFEKSSINWSTKYTVTKTKTFVKPVSPEALTIVNIYKVVKNGTSNMTDESNTETSYKIYGYDKIPYENGKMTLNSLSDNNSSGYNSRYGSEEEAQKALLAKSTSFKEILNK